MPNGIYGAVIGRRLITASYLLIKFSDKVNADVDKQDDLG